MIMLSLDELLSSILAFNRPSATAAYRKSDLLRSGLIILVRFGWLKPFSDKNKGANEMRIHIFSAVIWSYGPPGRAHGCSV
jgi:hypothetical protein